MLQFLWHDLSSKFGIIGPYYSSAQGFDSKFTTMACLQDAIFFFETYSFHVLAIAMESYGFQMTLWSQWKVWNKKMKRMTLYLHRLPIPVLVPEFGAWYVPLMR